MIIGMLLSGNLSTMALGMLIIIALMISLSFHEFGHAAVAKLYGDNTAELEGRLTLNPMAHIDPMGALMVIFIGFGWAKPVPTDPRNFTSRYADLWVSAAGPLMNLLLGFLVVNFFGLALVMEWNFFLTEPMRDFLGKVAIINMSLMIFNLLPIGPLDGHYILPYFLPRDTARAYLEFNAQYGHLFLLGLLLLSFARVDVFGFVFRTGAYLANALIIVRWFY